MRRLVGAGARGMAAMSAGAAVGAAVMGGCVDAAAGAPSSSSSSPSPSSPPPTRLGLIADIQYADVDDALSFNGKHLRRYRGALAALETAVAEWCAADVAAVVDLGDIIDQRNESMGTGRAILERVLARFAPALERGIPCYHLVGNHELYNFSRGELRELLPGSTGAEGRFYHSFRPAKGWRCVVLDTYEVNCIETDNPASVQEAYALLETANPNDLRAKRGTVNWSAGLEGLNRRFVPYNGAMTSRQLCWLEDEMRSAEAAGERVVVFTHIPAKPGSAVPSTLVWNYAELLDVLRRGPCVAVFAGHDHSGGYAVDRGEHGGAIHHITLPSPLHGEAERPAAHAVLELHSDRIELLGSGIVPSRTLRFGPDAAKL